MSEVGTPEKEQRILEELLEQNRWYRERDDPENANRYMACYNLLRSRPAVQP